MCIRYIPNFQLQNSGKNHLFLIVLIVHIKFNFCSNFFWFVSTKNMNWCNVLKHKISPGFQAKAWFTQKCIKFSMKISSNKKKQIINKHAFKWLFLNSDIKHCYILASLDHRNNFWFCSPEYGDAHIQIKKKRKGDIYFLCIIRTPSF